MISKHILTGLVVSSSLIFGGCGSSDSDSNDTDTPETNGYTIELSFVKGPVSGAMCNLYAVTSTGEQGDLLAMGMTVDGVVTFTEITNTGRLLNECSGGTYTDEATGETRTAPSMRAVAEVSTEADVTLTVSPLTEMAVSAAGSDLRNVDNDTIAEAFGLEDVDITRIKPTDLNTEAGDNSDEGAYGTALALISVLEDIEDAVLENLIDDLGDELADGAFSEEFKTKLSDAADALPNSQAGSNVDSDTLSGIRTNIDTIVDTTPPEITLSASALTLEYGGEANLTVTVVDGQWNGTLSCDTGVSYVDGVISSDEVVGSFECTATAIDRNQNQASATVTVTVVDTTAPVISAPTTLTIIVGESTAADISVTDAVDGTISQFTVQCPNEVSYIGETQSFFSQTIGSYECTVSATDDAGNSAQATIAITVESGEVNNAPVANAGADFTAPTGSSVALDGSQSSDADQDSLSFTWSFVSVPNGSNSSISNSTASSSASFVPDLNGDYQIQLQVSDGSDADNDTITVTAETKSWVINNSDVGANIAALVNVQSVTITNVNQNQFNQVSTSGVPDYSVVMTQADIDSLNNRPEAATDFDGGQTSATVGDTVEFGDDIGYNITMQGCDLGYWPPGPACPTDQQRAANIPADPSPRNDDCETSINTMGLMLNGTAIFNWSDGVSYNQQGVWNQLAPEFEIFDVDICAGHAQQQGNYHHHMFSSCLATLFDDGGQAHSPIYGYAADGYPIYGPYHAKDLLAKSAWVKRDYGDEANGYGCSDGQRSCVMVDPYDPTQGTEAATFVGPDTDETVASNSGNEFLVESGYYFEDYYYDPALTQQGGEYLDEHNGHDHDDLGYHYHTTAIDDNGSLVPVFPYNIGPKFYGNTPGGSIFVCNLP